MAAQQPSSLTSQTWSFTGSNVNGALRGDEGTGTLTYGTGNGGSAGDEGSEGNAAASEAARIGPKTPAQQVLSSPADRFGLLGLVNLIKARNPDLSMLALGRDLQQLGVDMNASG